MWSMDWNGDRVDMPDLDEGGMQWEEARDCEMGMYHFGVILEKLIISKRPICKVKVSGGYHSLVSCCSRDWPD